MSRLEDLVRDAESDIEERHGAVKQATVAKRRGRRPKLSFTLLLWITTAIVAAFQFDTVIRLVMDPTEQKIESDLSTLLQKAATSLDNYESTNGELPLLLPNPAIRGLVHYERRSSFSYRLSATVHTVTMVLDSTSTAPYREK